VAFSVTVHGGDVFRHNVDREAFSEVAAAATTVITQCEASRRHVLDELMLDRDARVEVVPPGVAVDTPGADAGRIGGFVVGVGHLHERKGFDVLVGACDRLLGQGVDIGCAIVGDGPERDHLATLIRAADIGDRVRLAGALPYEQVRELMRKATVVAAPAVTTGDGDRDAFPLVLLEAMASGTPVVSTPVGGIPELIDDGVDGILVPSRDRAGLAAGLQLLVQEPDTWARLSDAAVGKIRRQFDPSTTAQRLAGVLGRGATVAINLTQ
jgi:glycosyltransferase involved in cell wall biosynthesis